MLRLWAVCASRAAFLGVLAIASPQCIRALPPPPLSLCNLQWLEGWWACWWL